MPQRLLASVRPLPLMLSSALLVGVCIWAGCARQDRPQRQTAHKTPFVGAQVCAECHPDVFAKQSKSRHALTLRPAGPGVEAEMAGRTRLKHPETGVEYRLENRNGQLHQVRNDNGRESALPLSYFVGSGRHGMTPMAHDSSGWKYLFLTYYGNHGWDFSPMHGLSDASAQNGNQDGWPVLAGELEKCWGCHSTRLEFSGSEVDPQRSELGVRCESCHGPGRAHVEKARSGVRNPPMQNPGKWSSESFMALCQQCHNETATLEGTLMGISDDPADPSTVKYHVHGLQQSRCFKKSNGALRCTTCHDPHGDSETEPAFYKARCLSCHTPKSKDQVACPVAPVGDCLPCHMPKVEVEKYTRFADHWIRARSPFGPKGGHSTARQSHPPR